LKVGKKALLVLAKFKNDTLLAPLHKKIGLIYESDGIYEKALPHYLKSLDYYTKLNDQTGIASNLNNIGLIYYYQKNYKQALETFKRLLLEHYPSTIKQQLSTLTTDFNEWKGELEQIDDVCVIGIKF
jgi:tetratricopeptide (TPR) repeat protein